MPDGTTMAFQACVRTPFATLGITATDRHVTGIRFLAPSVRAFAPRPILLIASPWFLTWSPAVRVPLTSSVSGKETRLNLRARPVHFTFVMMAAICCLWRPGPGSRRCEPCCLPNWPGLPLR